MPTSHYHTDFTDYQDIRYDMTQCQTQLGFEPTDRCMLNSKISHNYSPQRELRCDSAFTSAAGKETKPLAWQTEEEKHKCLHQVLAYPLPWGACGS